MKKIVLILAFLFVCTWVFGQNTMDQSLMITPKSPEASLLDKFINNPYLSAAGIPDISIPLYEINLKNFSLPISISYYASGIRINDISSQVGIGWALNSGGMVSRNIMGISDNSLNGWLNINPDYFMECNKDYLSSFYDGTYDLAPDVFTYSVGQHSGSFYFDLESDIVKSLDDPIKINPIFNGYNMEFVIKDEFGNRYEYKTSEITEQNLINSPQHLANSELGNTGYKISRIITANRDTIEFSYESYNYQTPIFSEGYTRRKTVTLCHQDFEGLVGIDELINNNKQIEYTIQLVKSISSKNEIINFYYGNDPNLDIMTKTLDSITVTSNFDNLAKKRIHLEQSALNGRPYLDSIILYPGENQKRYSFNYYNRNSLPAFGSYKQDVFGFYNGNTQYHMIPVSDINLPYFGPSPANREVDSAKIITGILNEVIYPTGGSMFLRYEPNKVIQGGKKVYAPGVRVYNIEYKDIDNTKVKRIYYSYSGMNAINNFHIENDYIDYYAGCVSTEEASEFLSPRTWSSKKIVNDGFSMESGFFYGTVETQYYGTSSLSYTDVSKYKYYRDNFVYKPYLSEKIDFNENNQIVKKIKFEYVQTNINSVTGYCLDYAFNAFGYWYDCDFGLLCSNIPNVCSEPMMFYPQLGSFLYKRTTFYKSQEIATEYFYPANDSIVEQKKFDYNKNLIIRNIGIKNSDGDSLFTFIHYADDFEPNGHQVICEGTNESATLMSMANSNMIGIPIEKTDFVKKGNDVFIKSNELTILKEQDNRILLDRKLSLKNTDLIESNEYYYDLLYDEQGCIEDAFNDYQREEDFVVELYDDYGNMLQYHKVNDMNISIYWGYNNQYPVAKFENISFSTIDGNTTLKGYLDQLSNYTDLSDNSAKNNLKTLNQNIRNQLPGVMISTYTYNPLVGMTSETDPRGRTTFYLYDSSGRLKKVLDHDYYIIKEYEYNYQ